MSRPDELKLRGNGYWYAQWYDDQGNRRTKTFGHRDVTPRETAQRMYSRFLREWERSSTVRRGGEPAGRSIEALVAEYLEHARGYYRTEDGEQTGEAEQLKYALVSLVELFGDTDPQEFSPKDLEACQRHLVSTGIARTTINNRVNRIIRFFRWLTTRGEVRGVVPDLECIQPLSKGRTEAREPKALVPVHRSEVDAVFAALPRVVRDMVEVQWYTGMRSGELVIMRACDVDTSGPKWLYQPSRHKTKHLGKARRIFIGPKGQEILKNYLTTSTTAFLFSPAEAMRERVAGTGDARLRKMQQEVLERSGERYTPHSYRRAVIYACDAVSKAAGVPGEEWGKHHWTPYQLRRACATRLEKEYGVEAARVVLGHSKASTTELYVVRDGEAASRIMGEAG